MKKRFFLFARWTLILGLAALIPLTFYFFFLLSMITTHFEGKKWDIPSRIFGDALTLYPGLNIDSMHLVERLRRLSYSPVQQSVKTPGEYFLSNDRLEIYLHAFSYPEGEAKPRALRFKLSEQVIEEIRSLEDGQEVFTERLEPELVSEFFGKTREDRHIVALKEIPMDLQHAVIAIEDHRFYEHFGIDPHGILRAVVVNLRHGAMAQGGSTLTQQLVKNFFLTPERTLLRKINEAAMALIVEARYAKDEILECYLNEIYFGQRGSVGIHGVGEAARFYFGKEVKSLTTAECAILAALIKGPGIYSPFRNPEKSRERQKAVLARMVELGYINDATLQSALKETLSLKKPYVLGQGSAYFVDFLRSQLVEKYSQADLESQGLRIFTTLDPQIQQTVSQKLNEGLVNLEKQFPSLKREPRLQAAAIILQPQTGYILAMAGGRDFGESQFNRAVQAFRQPGSLFKPIVLASAFALNDPKIVITPMTELVDEPFEMKLPSGQTWKPKNYDEGNQGNVTVRQALEQSINIPFVKLTQLVGPEHIVETAHRLGINSELRPVASLALGTNEVSPLELARAYSSLINSGIQPDILSLRDVVNADGTTLERFRMESKSGISPEAAYLTINLMQGVVERGTGRGVRRYGITQDIGAKTGTTSDYRDAWFVGFSPDLLGLVWVGFDDNFSTHLTGSQSALPIWAEIMKEALAARSPKKFVDPPGVVRVSLDRSSKKIATVLCPNDMVMSEVFLAGTEPTDFCPLHPLPIAHDGSMWGKFKSFFGKKGDEGSHP